MSTDIERHILFVVVPRWGHIRPAITFGARIIKETPNLTITFPVALSVQSDVIKQVEQHFTNEKDQILRNKLRIIAIGPLVHRNQNFWTFISEFESFYSALASTSSYENTNGEVLLPIIPPELCMMDLLFRDIMRIVRRITEDVPIFAFSFGSTSMILRILIRGDVPAQAERLSRETGKPIEDILIQFYQPNEGTIINIPGLLPMYDYEVVPQLSPLMLRLLKKLGHQSYEFLQDCNGIIAASPRVYEPESTAALEEHLSKTNRPLYVIGPLGLTTTEQADKEPSPDKENVVAFLNRVFYKHGERSLIYISFGSIFWPPNIEASWKILEILVNNNTPMLLSHDDQRVVMPESLRSRLLTSETAMIIPWAPQNTILQHKATGWFLTHCGQNSVMEALYHGIPMIAWPIDTDQPLNAAYLSLKLHVAYELIEVRTGNGLKTLHRGITPRGTMEAVEEEFRSVMKKAWGPDGQRKREKVEELRKQLNSLWEEDGESKRELRRLITDYFRTPESVDMRLSSSESQKR